MKIINFKYSILPLNISRSNNAGRLTVIYPDIFAEAADQENTSDVGPENNPQCTTVYVGNLALEVSSFPYGLDILYVYIFLVG